MSAKTEFPPIWLGALRLVVRLIVLLGAVLLIHILMDWAIAWADRAGGMPLMVGILTGVLLSYALLLAVPFMPGIEIGLSLLILRGSDVAPFVYTATVLGLSIAYFAGRYMPYSWLHAIFVDLRMVRACHLIERLEPMDREQRLAHLSDAFPKWLAPLIGTGRYFVLAILLNVPGNALFGGGGGIAFAAGFSRLFRTPLAILIMALAVLPVPLGVWVYGAGILSQR